MSPLPTLRLEQSLARLARSPEDEEAWRCLYLQMWPYVLARMYRHLGGNRDLAEEASQEVFLRLVKYRPFARVQSAEGFRSYLTSMCWRVAQDALRHRLRLPAQELAESDEDLALVSEASQHSALEARDLWHTLLDGVGPRDRQALALWIEGVSLAEVARRTGSSYGGVAVRLHRLRRRLRQKLAAREEPD